MHIISSEYFLRVLQLGMLQWAPCPLPLVLVVPRTSSRGSAGTAGWSGAHSCSATSTFVWSYQTKHHTLGLDPGGLTGGHLLPHSPEAACPRTMWFLGRVPPGLQWPPSHCVLPLRGFSPFLFCKATDGWDQGPTIRGSSNPNYLPKPHGQMHVCWTLASSV
jgi:hypothetical protein